MELQVAFRNRCLGLGGSGAWQNAGGGLGGVGMPPKAKPTVEEVKQAYGGGIKFFFKPPPKPGRPPGPSAEDVPLLGHPHLAKVMIARRPRKLPQVLRPQQPPQKLLRARRLQRRRRAIRRPPRARA